MTTCLGKSCPFGLPCVSFVGVGQILCSSFPFGIACRTYDVTVFLIIAFLFIYQASSVILT